MTVSEYLIKLNARYRSGISTEHSYRADLLGLIEALVPGITITNEPKRVACGAPDYIITKRNIPVGYIEAKDIGADLHSKTYKEQFDRYRQSLDNLIISDYLTFQFFVNGSATTSITIGEISGNKIHPIPDNFERFTDLIKDFCEYVGQTIKSAQKLSKMMAAKAKLLANVIELALDPDKEAEGVNELQNINLLSQYESFKQVLIHDITSKAFADIYAQTIAYGMFAARLNDPSLENFTRQEAAELIPKSNPFLRRLFQYIAGYDLDDRIVWIVDALADIFRATNVEEMLKDFGKPTHQTDPFIHFYETFLAEYDPKLRKSRGVWYTPEPVVNFIVRAVDDILKEEFGLSQGLADTSKIKIKIPGQEKKPLEKEVHKVQILDPAAGTGTFLAEVIKQINNKFKGQQGIWSQYVEDHLIPRINGFEILMASYSMAHLKIELLLREMGYKPTRDQRLRVYLTNSLEEHHPDTGTIFANWLSAEANEANYVKRDTPVMVVLGNPPYSVSSTNRSPWIVKLLEDYKKGLNERNIQPLSDDYIKFIRFGQYYIEKNGSGILAYISNNSFTDGIIHRQMRKELISKFDQIYIIDLHGNAKRKERSPDGTVDNNVFDIMQGVSINLFISKENRKKQKCRVLHFNLFGTRQFKYTYLRNSAIKDIEWKELLPNSPNYFFAEKSNYRNEEYEQGFKINELFPHNASGIKTQRDDASITFNKQECNLLRKHFLDLPESELKDKYGFRDVRDWKISYAKNDLKSNPILAEQILYRPFDLRFMIYTGKTKGIMGYPRFDIMKHMLKDNIMLLTCRQQSTFDFQHALVAKNIIDMCTVSLQTKETTYGFPLYLYSDLQAQRDLTGGEERIPNLDFDIVNRMLGKLGMNFSLEKTSDDNIIAPIDLFDFIYSVLYSPKYRLMYKEFLRIDFPRIPYPKSKETFWRVVNLGAELRKIHLLESPIIDKYITNYPINGPNDVSKIQYEAGKVCINENQYFDGVTQVAWDFYIGGYQPAQKWLKDRKGRKLSYEDIMHYQKIIVALTETDRIMKEIDKIDFLA